MTDAQTMPDLLLSESLPCKLLNLLENVRSDLKAFLPNLDGFLSISTISLELIPLLSSSDLVQSDVKCAQVQSP